MRPHSQTSAHPSRCVSLPRSRPEYNRTNRPFPPAPPVDVIGRVGSGKLGLLPGALGFMPMAPYNGRPGTRGAGGGAPGTRGAELGRSFWRAAVVEETAMGLGLASGVALVSAGEELRRERPAAVPATLMADSCMGAWEKLLISDVSIFLGRGALTSTLSPFLAKPSR